MPYGVRGKVEWYYNLGDNERGSVVPSGVYFIRLAPWGAPPLTKKMVMLR